VCPAAGNIYMTSYKLPAKCHILALFYRIRAASKSRGKIVCRSNLKKFVQSVPEYSRTKRAIAINRIIETLMGLFALRASFTEDQVKA